MADKLYATLSRAAEEGKPVHTMGAIDPAQMSQMAANQEVVYISGWACSSLLTTGNNEVGPDYGCVSMLSAYYSKFDYYIQRLSLHNCAQPSPSNIPRPATP